MKRLFLKIVVPFSIAFFFFASTQSYADTIVLKNGNKIEVEKAYDQGDSIKGVKPYGSVSFPKSSVETVIYEKKTKHDSFEFDVWKSGITIEKALKIAESHDFPLTKVGKISGATKFNPKVYDDIKTADIFSYKTKLMGRPAKVTLCFTPTSRLLHKVIVSFSGIQSNIKEFKKEFKDEILTMLRGKYGNKDIYSKQLFGDTRTWHVKNKYTVKMIYLTGSIRIEYSDNALANEQATEEKKIKDKKRKEYTEKDSPKF